VVLLDEIEKAHPDVFNILLQVLDDGRLTDNLGHTVDFRNTVIIMTANIGAREIVRGKTSMGFQTVDDKEGTYQDMKDKVMSEVKRTFNPEFLNRLDEIVVFRPLGKEEILKITDLMISEINSGLSQKGIRIILDDDAKELLAKAGFDPAFGARPLRRTIQRMLEDPLSSEMLTGKFKGGEVFVKAKEDVLVFEEAIPVQVKTV
jgi:ATP-dependent Clp protease ATP-binding subunit ClpC